MNRVSALIPVKTLDQCKSRLSSCLSPNDRKRLQLALLQQVIRSLHGAARVSDVTVVTADADVTRLAVAETACAIGEPDLGGLNAAVTRGVAHLGDRGAAQILVLPSDLPLLDSDSCDAFLAAAETRGGFGIAGDLGRGGTNALTFPARRAPRFQYGEGSHALHRAQLPRNAADVNLIQFAFDIDFPEDLAHMFGAARRVKGVIQ